MSTAASDLFLVGLLSAMDAILDMEIIDVLKEINVREEIRDALLGRPNCLGEVFELAVNYEKGCWDLVRHSAAAMAIDENCLSPLYSDAVNWAEGTLLRRRIWEIARSNGHRRLGFERKSKQLTWLSLL